MTSGQTRDISSFLLTISFGFEIRASRISRAREPNSTADPFVVRSLSLATKLKGPKDNRSLASPVAVIIAFRDHLFGRNYRSRTTPRTTGKSGDSPPAQTAEICFKV